MDQTGIARGAQGDQVRALHNTLRMLGYELPIDEISSGVFGVGTLEAVRTAQSRSGLAPTGVVDELTLTALTARIQEHRGQECGQTPKHPTSYVVRGVVRFARGGFVVSATVKAFNIDLRHEQSLGRTATTDSCGQYEIEYQFNDFARSEVDTPNLIVRTYSRDGTVQAESATLFSAPSEAILDLVVGGDQYLGPSEFERVVARLLPALDQVPAQQITLSDLQWLGQETGLQLDWIAAYALSSALAQDSRIAIEVFYALLRELLPLRAGLSLFTYTATQLAALLDDAIAGNIIPDQPGDWRKNAVNQLQREASKALLGGHAAALGPILDAARVPVEIQQSFAQAYLGSPSTAIQLWNNLTNTLGADAVKQLQTGLQWGVVTFNHPPLVRALKQKLTKPSDVARLSQSDWRQTIDQLASSGQSAVPDRVQGANDDARRTFYAQQLHSFAQSAFPTTALAAQLRVSSFSQAGNIQQYLEANPDWNIDAVPARTFLKARPTDAQTAASLGRLQRVHRVTKNPEWSVRLLENNFGSAQAVARASIETLANTIGVDATGAGALRARARSISDAGAVIYARFSPTYNAPNLPPVAKMEKAAKDEIYQDIFGPAPLCGCDECGSVLAAISHQ